MCSIRDSDRTVSGSVCGGCTGGSVLGDNVMKLTANSVHLLDRKSVV